MTILTKIVITLAIVLFVSACGLGVTESGPKKWARGFAISILASLAGLVLCLIAYVWMK
jgi:CBS domain containing-hemolysin-like protein